MGNLLLLALVASACIATCSALKASEVAGIVKGEDGAYYLEHEGLKWQVADDPKNDRPFFYHADKGSQWEDPREPKREPAGRASKLSW